MLAGTFTEGPRYATWRTRGTTDWLLVNTLGGRGRFGLTSGRELVTAAGDLTLIRPRTRHDYGTAAGAERWSLQFAHFHPRPDWLPLLDWPAVAPGVFALRTAGEAHRRVTEALGRAAEAHRGGFVHAELFGLNALESALLWCATQDPGTHGLDPRLIPVLEAVAARLAEPHTVASLARVAGLSGSRLSHLFVAQVGLPPMRFVERQRMQAAEQLLDLTDRPVAEVARTVGFTDPLYFSSRFSRHAGLAPSAYRAHRR
jgi:AraC family transcriptional regulator of arabinose operon